MANPRLLNSVWKCHTIARTPPCVTDSLGASLLPITLLDRHPCGSECCVANKFMKGENIGWDCVIVTCYHLKSYYHNKWRRQNMYRSCGGKWACIRTRKVSSPLKFKTPRSFILPETGPKTVLIPFENSKVSHEWAWNFLLPEYIDSCPRIYCSRQGAPSKLPAGPANGTNILSQVPSINPQMLYGNSTRPGTHTLLFWWSTYMQSFWQYLSIASLNSRNWGRKRRIPSWPMMLKYRWSR